MKTYMANPDKIERKWYVVDAADCTLGFKRKEQTGVHTTR